MICIIALVVGRSGHQDMPRSLLTDFTNRAGKDVPQDRRGFWESIGPEVKFWIRLLFWIRFGVLPVDRQKTIIKETRTK